MIDNNENVNVPNIRKNYIVTDKADGLRKLLFVDSKGFIYLIPMTMDIEFTGSITENKDLFNTILDGEHVLHDKNNKYVNIFAAFDIYFINSKNLTHLPLLNNSTQEIDPNKLEYRLLILSNVVSNLKMISFVDKNKKGSLNLIVKRFFGNNNIFNGCLNILNNIDKNLYEYNTDGLIFTPINTGVASNTVGKTAPNYKQTWNESFKWKPVEHNTIDFLVIFKK